jgi:hypothetical protein
LFFISQKKEKGQKKVKQIKTKNKKQKTKNKKQKTKNKEGVRGNVVPPKIELFFYKNNKSIYFKT